ncbi:MAG: hypothetical protein ABR915_15585 [Thermoguttaceae bacterium]|jgi:hypothetical protein
MRHATVMTALLCLSASLAPAAAGAPAASPVTPVYYQLVLDSAMFARGNPKDVREIVLDLEQVGDHWSTIYGVSRNYNMGYHKGAVKEAKIAGDTITLKIGTDITPDKFIPGGQGEYTVTLKREADGRLSGTHAGKYNGQEVSGKVAGTAYAPEPAKDFVPLAPQEHPRLLLRKSDLPALREKAKTPFGQAAIRRIEAHGSPAALGLLYQLTGEKAWAVKAQAEAELYLGGAKPPGSPFVPMMAMWGRLDQLALVYDLCYDALSDDFKSRYRGWLSDLTFQIYFAPENMGPGANWHPVSNHTANVYSGLTLSGLALFDEASAAPKEPSPPFLEETLPPARDFQPADGVPVVELTPGKSPAVWLQTEALRRVTPDDPREVFYGLEAINPRPGTRVKVGDFPLAFGKMPPANTSASAVGGLKVGHLIEANATGKAKEPFTMAIYTVVEVKEPGQFTVGCPVSRSNLAQMSLAGKLLADGQVVKLEKGLYPLMCLVQWRMKWDAIAPSLRVATPADVKNWAARSDQIRAQYQTRLRTYGAMLETWKRTGGGDPAFARMLRLARFTSTLHCSDAVGRGGFQGESGHYSEDASSGHAQLWPIYRRVTGYDLTPYHEYPDYIPRKIIGGPQDITGTTRIGGNYFAALFPVLKEEWKPELLTAWHNEMKVADPALPVEVLKEDPVRAFLSYPLGLKPAPVGTRLPRVWEAPGLGYYVIRSGWGPDAFIAQVALKHQGISGWSGANAGTYRLLGLGQEWATGPTDRYRSRQEENIVWLPEADLDDGARGHLTCFEADDKTMVLSVDLNEVYERRGRYWTTHFGHLRYPVLPQNGEKLPEPSGITGMRSLAFDFSGQSGAPCLFVVVDRIDGGKDAKRLWLFQPPGNRSVSTDSRGFTVTCGAASLHGVFATPANPKVNTDPVSWDYVNSVGTNRGAKVHVSINAVSVPGKDHYFFVGTVAAGKHPEAKVAGSGLDAVVSVGNRTVRFDGQKIVLGTTRM